MAVAADVRNVVETPIAQLHPSLLQHRTEFPDDYLQSLAESIRRNSVITPLLVRPSRKGFEIIDGECRWRAAKIAGLETVPVDVQELGDLEAMNRILASFENRRALGDLDEGRAFKRRMLLGGDDAARVAASIGLSERYVYDAIKLVDDLIPDAQQFLQRAGSSSPRGGQRHAEACGAMTAVFKDLDVLDDDGQIEASRRKVGRPKKGTERSPFKTGLYLSDPDVPKETSTSWWIGLSAEAFRRAAEAEQERMQKSKDGRKLAPLSGAFE